MGDAAANVESEIENVLEMFCPHIFNYFLALKMMLLPMLSQKLKMFWKCFALTSLIIF